MVTVEELRILKRTTPMREWDLRERHKDVVAMAGICGMRADRV